MRTRPRHRLPVVVTATLLLAGTTGAVAHALGAPGAADPTPSGNQLPIDDNHAPTPATPSAGPSPTAVRPDPPRPHRGAAAPTVEPADDRGATAEPGDDRGATAEPGDDHGATAEPGDDHGATAEPGDDHGATAGPGDDRGATPEPGDDSSHGGDDSSSGGGDDSSSHGGADDSGRSR